MWSKGEDKAIVPLLRNEKGLGILDTLFVCILVSILIGTVFPYYQTLAQEARESALQTGLANIRKGVELYHVLQGDYPENLKDLVRKRYLIAAGQKAFFSGEYLQAQAQDPEGNLLDPFGNRYLYDKKNGIVASGTKGYEKW